MTTSTAARLFLLAGTAASVALAGGALAAPATTATQMKSVSFDTTHVCTANFVRSASGLIMETNRVCVSDDRNGDNLQFRPQSGKVDPACPLGGLVVDSGVYSGAALTAGSALEPLFTQSELYRVCEYDPAYVAPVA